MVSSNKNTLSHGNGGCFDWLRCYQTAPNDLHINGHPHDYFLATGLILSDGSSVRLHFAMLSLDCAKMMG